MADLSSAIDHLLRARRISALSQSYRKDNPIEYAKVLAYLEGGARPLGVVTEMGMGLVEVEDVRRGVAPPPPPPPQTWTGPVTITTGGVYDVSAESTDASPAVFVKTAQPVTIRGRVRNLASGSTSASMIKVQAAGAQVVVEDLHAYGGQGYLKSARWFEAISGYKSIVLRRCTIDKTRGIQLENSAAGGTIVIEKIRHDSIQGNGKNPPGNLVQFRNVVSASIDVGWVEVVNGYPDSNPEDIISVYGTSGLRLHDFFFDGQYDPENNENSQNTVTFETGAKDAEVWNGYMVGVRSIGTYGAGGNIKAHDCQNVWTGLLPNGQTANYYSIPWAFRTGNGSGNVVENCHAAYMNQGAYRRGELAGATSIGNTWDGPPVTAAMEQALRDAWTQHKAGVRIGAP